MIKRRRNHRIGLDLDKPSQLRLYKAFFNAKHFFPNVRIEVLRTGHGFHIRIYQPNINPLDNLAIRRHLGDDWGRIHFDEMRIPAGLLDWVDTLFNAKHKNGHWTREEPCNVLSEPFCSKLPAKKRL